MKWQLRKLFDKGKAQTKIEAKTETKAKPTETIKKSKDAKPDVDKLAVDPNTNENYTQQEWDRVGADRAIEQFKVKRKEFENQGYLDGLIASKYKLFSFNEPTIINLIL